MAPVSGLLAPDSWWRFHPVLPWILDLELERARFSGQRIGRRDERGLPRPRVGHGEHLGRDGRVRPRARGGKEQERSERQ